LSRVEYTTLTGVRIVTSFEKWERFLRPWRASTEGAIEADLDAIERAMAAAPGNSRAKCRRENEIPRTARGNRNTGAAL
jgi:hypothetical protein